VKYLGGEKGVSNRVEIFKTSRGAPAIAFNGYLYHQKKVYSDKRKWVCRVHSCNKALAVTDLAMLEAQFNGYHIHPPDEIKVATVLFKDKILRMYSGGKPPKDNEVKRQLDVLKSVMPEILKDTMTDEDVFRLHRSCAISLKRKRVARKKAKQGKKK